MTRLASRSNTARFLPLVGVLMLAAACHQAVDLLDTERPTVRTPVALRAAPLRGDTATLVLSLGVGSTSALGSVTADVAVPLDATSDWRFLGCDALQGEPLLACHATEAGVRLAAAWAAGTHGGDLVAVTFVRTRGSAIGALEDARLRLTQVSGVTGRSLADSLEVREGVVR